MDSGIRNLDQQRHLVQQKINQLEMKFKEGTQRDSHILRELPPSANTISTRNNDNNYKGKGSIVRGNNPQSRPKYQANNTIREREKIVNLSSTMPIQQHPQPSKDDEVKALKEMMQSIIEGQKNIQMELNQLKKTTPTPVNTFTNTAILNDLDSSQNNPLFHNKPEKSSVAAKNPDPYRPSFSKAKTSKVKSQYTSNNTSSVVVTDKPVPAIRKNKKKELDALVQELKKQGKQGERFCIDEETKSKIWSEVEVRVRQSDKEYRDPMHRNNKHEFQHLMNTFELQRKLKDDVIERVYAQCNDQIYK